MEDIFKLRKQSDAVNTFWMDGVRMGVLNNKIHLFGGWNDDQPELTFNTHLISENMGETFTGTTAPWVKRHDMGWTDKPMLIGGKMQLVIFSGDGTFFPDEELYQNNAWAYNDDDGWTEITDDNGAVLGDRSLMYCCVHDGYCYAAAGRTLSGVYFNNVVRTNDFLTWEVVSTLSGEMLNLESGSLVSHGGALYFIGGGRFAVNEIEGESSVVCPKVFKSTNNGVTWTKIFDDPAAFKHALWANCCSAGGYLWYKGGSDVHNAVYGDIWYSKDGVEWSQLLTCTPTSHANCIGNYRDECYVGMGIERNDFYRIKKIASSFRYYR